MERRREKTKRRRTSRLEPQKMKWLYQNRLLWMILTPEIDRTIKTQFLTHYFFHISRAAQKKMYVCVQIQLWFITILFNGVV